MWLENADLHGKEEIKSEGQLYEVRSSYHVDFAPRCSNKEHGAPLGLGTMHYPGAGEYVERLVRLLGHLGYLHE